jgi:lipopolysaccharide transport system ATP-binding protein
MSDVVIQVENLGKKYIIRHQGGNGAGYETFRDVLSQSVRSIWASNKRQSRLESGTQEEFWALKDVSFEVKQGEVIGIIGRNGAGKSTLLKILSRITEPTTGQIRIRGRVASLLEVGTGFHPELTGRENIFLNGSILGMSRTEIKQKFDEIVAFAEVEKFLDTPVKHYSSGMYVRLAFAVAAHLEPEILIVDEVLAVGDAAFQKKCLGKMGEVSKKEGKTILFVSHNMVAIKSLCQYAIWLDQGKFIDKSNSNTLVDNYLKNQIKNNLEKTWILSGEIQQRQAVSLQKATLIPLFKDQKKIITVETPLRFEVYVINKYDEIKLNLSFVLYTIDGVCVFNSGSQSKLFSAGIIKGSFEMPQNFLNNEVYTVRILVVQDQSIPLLDIYDVITFEVHDIPRTGKWYGKWVGVIRPKFEWEIDQIESISYAN